MVTARDGAPDPRLATATVTVEVQDVEDELPTFKTPSYEARVPENVPDFMVAQVKVGSVRYILSHLRLTLKKVTGRCRCFPDIFLPKRKKEHMAECLLASQKEPWVLFVLLPVFARERIKPSWLNGQPACPPVYLATRVRLSVPLHFSFFLSSRPRH